MRRRQINQYLNAQGYKTSQGGTFNKNSLRTILQNKRYIGIYTYRDKEYPGQIPRIIDDDLFERAQVAMGRNKRAPARNKATGEDEYLLTLKLWFGAGWFDDLKKGCTAIPEVSDDALGVMRMTGDDGFEYWIGLFAATETAVPEGFASVDLPAGEVGVVWLYGNDKNGELYSMEASDLSMGALAEKGWKYANDSWFFERYNNPRFTKPDEEGNVILDICAYLE